MPGPEVNGLLMYLPGFGSGLLGLQTIVGANESYDSYQPNGIVASSGYTIDWWNGAGVSSGAFYDTTCRSGGLGALQGSTAPSGGVYVEQQPMAFNIKRADVEVSADFRATWNIIENTPMFPMGAGLWACGRMVSTPASAGAFSKVIVATGVYFYPEVVNHEFTRWVLCVRENPIEKATLLAVSTEALPPSPENWYSIMLRIEENVATGLVNGVPVVQATIPDRVVGGTWAGPMIFLNPDTNSDPVSAGALFKSFLATTPRTTLSRANFQPWSPGHSPQADPATIASTSFNQGFTLLTGTPFVAERYQPGWGGAADAQFSRLGTPTSTQLSAVAAFTGAADGWAFGEVAAFTGPGVANQIGLILRANPATGRALMLAFTYNGAGGQRVYGHTLYVLAADGSLTQVAQANLPTPPSYSTAITPQTSPSDSGRYMLGARVSGTSIKTLTTWFNMQSSAEQSIPGATVIDYTLSGDLAAEFGTSTYFGVAAQSPRGGFEDFTFISDSPHDIVTSPGNMITPTEAIVPADATDIVFPEAGAAGWTAPDGSGFYVGYDRDIATGGITPYVAIRYPDGTTTILATGQVYPTGVPTDPLNVMFHRNGNHYEVLYGGRVIWFYDLTPADLSGLPTSTDYVSFLDINRRPHTPPPGTVIIGTAWVPVSKTLRLTLGGADIPIGRSGVWQFVTIHQPYSLVIAADGTVFYGPAPDQEIVDSARAFYQGGHGEFFLLDSATANIIGAAGYGSLLSE